MVTRDDFFNNEIVFDIDKWKNEYNPQEQPKTLVETINDELMRMYYMFYNDKGDWNRDQFLEAVKPLHEALKILAEKES